VVHTHPHEVEVESDPWRDHGAQHVTDADPARGVKKRDEVGLRGC
jgi:hypothetical protein